MPVFTYSFLVSASLQRVADFHRETRALKRLTPPPVFVQLHHVEPLGEGSVSEFTMWFGPVPLRWRAVHSRVDPLHGFTDTQQAGPMLRWQHTHRFDQAGDGVTRVSERVEYTYKPGWRGWLARLIFNPIMLRMMFIYRGWITRFSCR
jgi:ligand-binding SRPBCC domain-containing protein